MRPNAGRVGRGGKGGARGEEQRQIRCISLSLLTLFRSLCLSALLSNVVCALLHESNVLLCREGGVRGAGAGVKKGDKRREERESSKLYACTSLNVIAAATATAAFEQIRLTCFCLSSSAAPLPSCPSFSFSSCSPSLLRLDNSQI